MNNQFEDKFAALENKTAEKLKGKFEELQTLRDESAISSVTVAFKARLNDDITVSDGQIIMFPTVMFNVGDAYSTRTGKFTAPASGTYLFTAAFCVKYQKILQAGLMVDGTEYTATTLYGDGSHECITADTVAVLSAGQKVWVEVLSGSSSGKIIDQTNSHRWNTFSGTVINVKQ